MSAKISLILYLSRDNNSASCPSLYKPFFHASCTISEKQKDALDKKVAQISQELSSFDATNYIKHDLYEEIVEKGGKAQNIYVKSLAQDILDDKRNIDKLKTAEYCLVHSDLNRDNILFQQHEEGWKANIVDWEGVELLPKDHQLASYLSSSLLIEGESVENCMKTASKIDKDVDKDFVLFLMKARLFKGIDYFVENKNAYTENNKPVADEILNKYFIATKKIKHYEAMMSKNDASLQSSNISLGNHNTGR